MYGKFFESAFTGSMMGAGEHVFALWGWVIAHTRNSHVEINPKYVALMVGSTEERMRSALAFLCAPDSASRNPDHEGRRLVNEGGNLYFVPSAEHYRKMASEEDRRAYFTEAKRKQRERTQAPDTPPPDQKYLTEARVLIHYLNETAGRTYRETDKNLTRIRARLEEVKGDVDGCKKMIARQVSRWGRDPKMSEYLRIETLFGKEKFSDYYDNRDLPSTQHNTVDKNERSENIKVPVTRIGDDLKLTTTYE